MKRLILDFEKDGKEYVFKMYHPLSDARDGHVTYSSSPKSIIDDLAKNITDYLPTVPSLEIALTKKFVQESANWYYIHKDKINAYEFTIQSLLQERDSLEDKVELLEGQLKIKETQAQELHTAYETKIISFKETIQELRDELEKLKDVSEMSPKV